MTEQHLPICMAEEYWINTYFSVARYYGGIKTDKYSYKIVNKNGITLFELSDPDSKHYVGGGDKKAIEPGDPADLVREDFLPFYRKLGRDTFIQVLTEHQQAPDVELKKIYKEMIAKEKKCQSKKKTKADTLRTGKIFGEKS